MSFLRNVIIPVFDLHSFIIKYYRCTEKKFRKIKETRIEDSDQPSENRINFNFENDRQIIFEVIKQKRRCFRVSFQKARER